MIGCHDETPHPFCCVFASKERRYPLNKISSVGVVKSDKEYAIMCARSKRSHVGKIQVLGYQETTFLLACIPNGLVRVADQSFLLCRMNVMTQLNQVKGQFAREVFVQLN